MKAGWQIWKAPAFWRTPGHAASRNPSRLTLILHATKLSIGVTHDRCTTPAAIRPVANLSLELRARTGSTARHGRSTGAGPVDLLWAARPVPAGHGRGAAAQRSLDSLLRCSRLRHFDVQNGPQPTSRLLSAAELAAR